MFYSNLFFLGLKMIVKIKPATPAAKKTTPAPEKSLNPNAYNL